MFSLHQFFVITIFLDSSFVYFVKLFTKRCGYLDSHFGFVCCLLAVFASVVLFCFWSFYVFMMTSSLNLILTIVCPSTVYSKSCKSIIWLSFSGVLAAVFTALILSYQYIFLEFILQAGFRWIRWDESLYLQNFVSHFQNIYTLNWLGFWFLSFNSFVYVKHFYLFHLLRGLTLITLSSQHLVSYPLPHLSGLFCNKNW